MATKNDDTHMYSYSERTDGGKHVKTEDYRQIGFLRL